MFVTLFNLLKTHTHSLSQNVTNIWFLLHSYTFTFKLKNLITVYIAIYDYLQPKYYNILSKKKNYLNIYYFFFKILLIVCILV